MRQENLHLTLRFIGEVDGVLQDEIDSALDQIRIPPFSLRLDGVGSYGKGRKARILWAGVTPNETLGRLQAKIETALVRLGLPPEGRKFQSHITLARLKSPDPRRLGDFLAHNGGLASEDLAIDHFTLYSSQLGSSGAIYRAEHVFPLKG